MYLLIFLIIFLICYILFLYNLNNYDNFDNIETITYDNLFNFCDNTDNPKENVYYAIKKESTGNSVLCLGVYNNKILTLTNEWLYLIVTYYHNKKSTVVYDEIIHYYNNIISSSNSNTNIVNINENVIPFITSFSTGTIHGYCGLFYILMQYINNLELYKAHKILVYKNSQKGILDIINFFINDKDIIYLEPETIYKFDSMIIIPNKYHTYSNSEFNNKVSGFIQDNIISKSLNKKTILIYPKICIMKSSISSNLTQDGIFNNTDIINFCTKYDLVNIEPTNYNEIELIQIMNACEYFITSWGTTFLKNLIYISDKCKRIIVFIYGNAFINQYKNDPQVITKFKSANIEYKIIHSIDEMIINL